MLYLSFYPQCTLSEKTSIVWKSLDWKQNCSFEFPIFLYPSYNIPAVCSVKNSLPERSTSPLCPTGGRLQSIPQTNPMDTD